MALSSSQTSEQKIRVRIRAEHFPFLSDNSEKHMRMWQRLVRELNPDGTGSESEPREECEDCDECDVEESFAELFDELEKALGQENGSDGKEEDDGVFQMVTEGRLRMRGNLCEISYQEGEDVYGDAVTNLTFSKRHPETVILSRSGEASLSISFEAGRHHIGSYRLPFLQQEDPDLPHLNLTSYARRVENRLLEEGYIELDYLIEVRGLDTVRTVYRMEIDDLPVLPRGIEDLT